MISEERTIEIEQGEDVKEVEVVITWKLEVDRKWGADADGNRGVCREWWEVVAIDFIKPKKSELTEAEIQAVYNMVDEMSAPREV